MIITVERVILPNEFDEWKEIYEEYERAAQRVAKSIKA